VDQGTAAPPAAKEAQPGGRGANPARARETRLNEAGEPVPVVRGGRADASRFAAPPPATAEDQANQVRKKLFAEPMAKTEKQVQAAKPAPTTAENKPAQDALAAPGDGKSSGAPGSASALGLVSRAPVAAGESRLCGEVRDPSGRPVAGAQAVLTDLARTAVTDAQGMFCLSAPPGEHPLSVMAVGFGESRQSVQVGGQESAVSVTLAAVPVLESGPKSTWGTARSLFRSGGPSQTIAPAEPRDAYSALPDSVRREVREVQRLDATARTRRSAALYDATASRWEGVLRRVAGGPLEIEARWNLGEARFHAWEAGPNARRADAAIEALTGYAVRAPAGPNRDQAARWLDRVRR
jgi:hypothetical protein